MKKEEKTLYLSLINETREFLNERLTGRLAQPLTSLDKRRVCMFLYHYYQSLSKRGVEDTDPSYLTELPSLDRGHPEAN